MRRATSWVDSSPSRFNFSISRTRRIVILSVGIGLSPKGSDPSAHEDLLPPISGCGIISEQGGGIIPEWVAGSARNRHADGRDHLWPVPERPNRKCFGDILAEKLKGAAAKQTKELAETLYGETAPDRELTIMLRGARRGPLPMA